MNLLATTAESVSIPMAIVDFVPVILFFIAMIIVQRDVYFTLTKWGFSCLAAGSIMVLTAGFFKALHKILLACGAPADEIMSLEQCFFPIQGTGFMLVFLGLLSPVFKTKKATTTAMAPLTIIFLAGQILGCAGMQFMLGVFAKKLKKPLAIVLFVVAFVAMLGMGYLSSKFDGSSNMHWIAQLTNIVSNGSLLAGVVIIHKAGLKELDL